MYGIWVIGHSGAGKTTLVKGMGQANKVLNRRCKLINLDPAADGEGFDVDINELISVEQVMKQLDLGPNGALLYCFDFLYKNIEWLLEKIKQQQLYLIFDMPGQIQLYIQNQNLNKIFKSINASITVVQLTDSALIGKIDDFISLGLSALSSMMNIQAPFIHVLSKIDMLKGQLKIGLRQILEMNLIQILQQTTTSQKPLRNALAKIFDSYNKVCFCPLLRSNPYTLQRLIYQIDQANGYIQNQKHSLQYITFLKKQKQEGIFQFQCQMTNMQAYLNGSQSQEEQLNKFTTDYQS